MKAVRRTEGTKSVYEVTLDEEDLNLISDLSSEGTWTPYGECDTQFRIFPHPTEFESSFKPLPSNPDGYYIYMGGHKDIEELKEMIRQKGRIPIEETVPMFGKQEKVNYGFVELKVRDTGIAEG